MRATIGRLGRWLRDRVRLRRPGTSRPVATRMARNGAVAIAYDMRGHGPPLVLVQGLGLAAGAGSRWPTGWPAASR